MVCQILPWTRDSWILAGADPGFPVEGGANPPGRAPTYDFAKIFQKTAWNWEKFGSWGARAGGAPLDPPLLSDETKLWIQLQVWSLCIRWIVEKYWRFCVTKLMQVLCH